MAKLNGLEWGLIGVVAVGGIALAMNVFSHLIPQQTVGQFKQAAGKLLGNEKLFTQSVGSNLAQGYLSAVEKNAGGKVVVQPPPGVQRVKLDLRGKEHYTP